MDQNLKIQIGNLTEKLQRMSEMGLSKEEFMASFTKAESDTLEKAMVHKYLRKEGDKYIYEEPKGDKSSHPEEVDELKKLKSDLAWMKRTASTSSMAGRKRIAALEDKISSFGSEKKEDRFTDGTKANSDRVQAINDKLKDKAPGTVEDDDPAAKKDKIDYSSLNVEQLEKVKKDLLNTLQSVSGNKPNEAAIKIIGDRVAEVHREIDSRSKSGSSIESLFTGMPEEAMAQKTLTLPSGKTVEIVRKLDKSGGQHTLTYSAPEIADNKFWDPKALMKTIEEKVSINTEFDKLKSAVTEAKKMHESEGGVQRLSNFEYAKSKLFDFKTKHNLFDKSENDEMEKGGEGSRGGKIIGHTKSGKPIYEDHKHESHSSFDSSDHRDAYNLHERIRPKNEVYEKHGTSFKHEVSRETQQKVIQDLKSKDKRYENMSDDEQNHHYYKELKNHLHDDDKERSEALSSHFESQANHRKAKNYHQYRMKDKSDTIKKSEEEVEKGGEGSRGGNIIGHTDSGKPIYDTFDHPSHAKFSRKDHFDAGNTHTTSNEHVKKHRDAANTMPAKKGSEKHPEQIREEKRQREEKKYR